MARRNNMTWTKKIALRYGSDFGTNVVSVYTERGLARRVHTMNRVKFGVSNHKAIDKVSRDYKLHITRTYKQIQDRSIIENRIRQRLNKSRI